MAGEFNTGSVPDQTVHPVGADDPADRHQALFTAHADTHLHATIALPQIDERNAALDATAELFEFLGELPSGFAFRQAERERERAVTLFSRNHATFDPSR